MRYLTFVAALIACLIASSIADDSVIIEDATVQYKYTFQTIKSAHFCDLSTFLICISWNSI
jgi:hypothetical protein